MDTTDRSILEGKLIPELQQIASGLGIEGTQRLRKAGLIDAIVERSDGATSTPVAAASNDHANGDHADGDGDVRTERPEPSGGYADRDQGDRDRDDQGERDLGTPTFSLKATDGIDGSRSPIRLIGPVRIKNVRAQPE